MYAFELSAKHILAEGSNKGPSAQHFRSNLQPIYHLTKSLSRSEKGIRQEVQEQLKAALHEQRQGKLATGPRQTVKQFLTYWLEDVQKPAVRARTFMRYEIQLRRLILPSIGSLQLSKLAPLHIQAFYGQMLRKVLLADGEAA